MTIALGTMTFGEQVDLATAQLMIERCGEAGVTWIDTANVYSQGAAEEMVGRLIRGRRHEFAIATKVGMPSIDAQGQQPLSAAAIGRCIDMSLRRLGTDHVDLYYLHQPDRITPIAETLAALDDAVRAGKVLRTGVSNYPAWQVADIEACAIAHGYARPEVGQILYNLVARRAEDEYLELSRAHEMESVAYNPLAGGLLSGKHSGAKGPTLGRFSSSALASRYRERYWHAEMFAAVDELSLIASRAGITLVELAYRWICCQPGITGLVVGASSVTQLEINLVAATGSRLDEDVLSSCDDVWRSLRGVAPGYSR